nr:reverse transcriptase domain-containing protein [Tanacetum cinerariifolium]
GCTYKEFLTCNPKEYDGKRGAIVYTHWIEKMESVLDMSGCKDSQRLKYIAGLFVVKSLTWWNSEIRTRGQEAAIGMSWEDFRTLTIEEFFLSNEMQKFETELWNHVMVEAGQAMYTDRFHELARLVPHLVTQESKRIGRVAPRNVNPINARDPVARTCFKCGSTDHIKSAFPMINQAQRLEGNKQNQVVAVNEGVVGTTQGNPEQRFHSTKLIALGAPVSFLGHVINGDGIHVDPSKIEAVKNQKALELHL